MQNDKSASQSEPAMVKDAAADASAIQGSRRVSSADLFGGAREIEIEHNGRRYLLRITQTGKLILTA